MKTTRLLKAALAALVGMIGVAAATADAQA